MLLELSSCAVGWNSHSLALAKLVIKYLPRRERKIKIVFHIDCCQKLLLIGLTIRLRLPPLQRGSSSYKAAMNLWILLNAT